MRNTPIAGHGANTHNHAPRTFAAAHLAAAHLAVTLAAVNHDGQPGSPTGRTAAAGWLRRGPTRQSTYVRDQS